MRGIELREDDEPGFWEGYGYHNYGDPWSEQRYAGRLSWQLGTRRRARRRRRARTKSIVLDAADWPGHRAGQHVDVRLTAEDGYQAQRSYSIASAPEDEHLVLTVERLDDGEVSPYLTDELRPGDELELRGPIGGYFVWQESLGGPLLLVAGGSGVVPLRAMLRHHRAVASDVPVRLLYSARTRDDVIYRDELARATTTTSITLTREQPRGLAAAAPGRIDPELLAEVALAAGGAPARLRLRPDRLRRRRRRRARRARPRPDPHQDRAVRPDMMHRARRQRDRRRPPRGLRRRAHRGDGRLRGCGAAAFLAEAVVYMRGPGRVARCRACGEVLMVLVTIRGITCVDLRGIAELRTEG